MSNLDFLKLLPAVVLRLSIVATFLATTACQNNLPLNSSFNKTKASSGSISLKINKGSFFPKNTFGVKATTLSDISFKSLELQLLKSDDSSLVKGISTSLLDNALSKNVTFSSVPINKYKIRFNLNYTENNISKNMIKTTNDFLVETNKTTIINQNLEVERSVINTTDLGDIEVNIGVNVVDKVINSTTVPIGVESKNISQTTATNIIKGDEFVGFSLENEEIISLVRTGSNFSIKRVGINGKVLADNSESLNDPNSYIGGINFSKLFRVIEDGSNIVLASFCNDKSNTSDSSFIKIYVFNKSDLKLKNDFRITTGRIDNNGEFELVGKNGKYGLFFSPSSYENAINLQKFNTSGLAGSEIFFSTNINVSRLNLIGAYLDNSSGLFNAVLEVRGNNYRNQYNLDSSAFSIPEIAFKNELLTNYNYLQRIMFYSSNGKVVSKNGYTLFISDIYPEYPDNNNRKIDTAFQVIPGSYDPNINLAFYNKDKDGLQNRVAEAIGVNNLSIVYSSMDSVGKSNGLYLTVVKKANKAIISNTFIPILNQVNSNTNLINISMDNNDNVIFWYANKNNGSYELKTLKYDSNGNKL